MQKQDSSSLWVGPAGAPDSARQVSSGHSDGLNGIAVGPDGKIVYSSNPSGNWDLFVMDANGANPRQLTFDGRYHALPAVCDSGHTIVYFGQDISGYHLWTLDPQSGATVQLTRGAGEEFPQCDALGSSVYYFGTATDGTSHIYRTDIHGGPPVQLSSRVTISNPFVSPDGSQVAFAEVRKDGTVAGVLIDPQSPGHENLQSFPSTLDPVTHAGCWMPDNRSVALSDVRTGTPNLWQMSFANPAGAKQLTHFTSGIIWDCRYTQDGKSIVLARGAHQTDVVLFTSHKN